MNDVQNLSSLLNGVIIPLEPLLGLPKVCIYALVNTKDMKIQIYKTSSFINSISQLLREIHSGREYKDILEDKNSVSIVILEPCKKEDLNVLYSFYVQKYKEMGYTLYEDINITKYTLEKQIVYKDYKYYYALYLVSPTKSTKIELGLFSKHKDLKDHVSKWYPNNIVRGVFKYNHTEN